MKETCKPKFKQPVSMKVTVEQYEKDLKEPLEKLGYEWGSYTCHNNRGGGLNKEYPFLSTNYMGRNNKIASDFEAADYHIDHYNPELFLAIAAMTEGDTPIVGEYYIGKGNIFPDVPLPAQDWILKEWIELDYYRKATLEELVSRFSNKNEENGCMVHISDLYYNSVLDLSKAGVSLFSGNTSNKNETMKDTRIISSKDAQRIIDIACSTWETELAERWAVDIVKGRSVNIEDDFYKSMRKACTQEQHELFDEIFGSDEVEKTYSIGDRFKVSSPNGEYLLASASSDFAIFIDTKSGCRFGDAFEVNNLFSIKESEIIKAHLNFKYHFTKI